MRTWSMGVELSRFHRRERPPSPARLVAKDVTNDLALLQGDRPSSVLPTLRSAIRVGESIAVFGYPLTGILATNGNFTVGNVTATAGLPRQLADADSRLSIHRGEQSSEFRFVFHLQRGGYEHIGLRKHLGSWQQERAGYCDLRRDSLAETPKQNVSMVCGPSKRVRGRSSGKSTESRPESNAQPGTFESSRERRILGCRTS